MEIRKEKTIRTLLVAAVMCVTFGHKLYAPPSHGIQQIGPNAKAVGPINMNGFQLINLDTSNLSIGGGGGGTGTIDNITLNTPASLFNDPIIFTISGGLASGALTLADVPAGTVFANLTGGITTPSFGTLSSLGLALTLNGIGAPTANVSLANKKIINLADPSAALDAANKQYVDAVAAVGPPHPAVAAATTATAGNITLSGEQTIDGVLTSASRVLVKNQTAGAENGIYVSAAGAWARASDADTGTEVSGNVFVPAGTSNGGTQWGVTTPQPITLNTTAISYTLTGASTIYTAGSGITQTGNQFSLAASVTSDIASKVAPTRTINTTAPLTGGGDLSANRTFSIAAATASVNGYLAATDFANFTAKPPNNRTIATSAPLTGGGDLSANRTLAIAAASSTADGYLSAANFHLFFAATPQVLQAGAGGLLTISASADPPINRVVLNQILTSNLNIVLPPASNYNLALGLPSIVIDDIVGGAQANFGITITRSGSDTIDGVTQISLPRGSGYSRLNSNGANKWVSTSFYATAFRDGSDPTKIVIPNTTNVPANTTVQFNIPGQNFSGLVESHSVAPDHIVATGADNIGNLEYFSLAVVPDTAGHGPGESLQVQADGSYQWNLNPSGSAPYVMLDGTTSPIVWNCIAGQRKQNAYVTLTGTPSANHVLQINGPSSGYDFTLIVVQDGTGSRTISALPTGSLVTGNGLGVPTLSTGANAVDILTATYTGQNGLKYVWDCKTNATGVAPPACTTAPTTALGATSGTSLFQQNAGNKAYLSANFVADATTACKAEANIAQSTGAPNYPLQAYVCADAPAHTYATAVTANGSNIVHTNAAQIFSSDLGQAVTGPGITPPAYVLAIDTTNAADYTFTMYSTRTGTGGSNVNAGGGAGTGTVQVYGLPGAPCSAGSDVVNTLSAPATITGAGSADVVPVTFNNMGVSGLTIGTMYHFVIGTMATFPSAGQWDSANFISWLQPSGNAPAGGFKTHKSASLTTGYSLQNATKQQRFKLFH